MSNRQVIFKSFGSYIPEVEIENKAFHSHHFHMEDGAPLDAQPEVITRKFEKITGIRKRRYATENMLTSDMGVFASQKAIEKSGIDKEDIDHIIVAHNFGDVDYKQNQSVIMPSLAARIKQGLDIKNPSAVAYDVIFGCPGWVQGVIQAYSFIQTGMAKNVLIVGCEMLSRVLDPYDRDSMIFSDGAGACILSSDDASGGGILSYSAVTHATVEADYLYCGPSYKKSEDATKFIKMKGRKIYEYAISQVPKAMKEAFDKSGKAIGDLKKIFIHQANEKMDEAIIQRFYKLYEIEAPPENVMPMCIQNLGNSSVATIPTLIDLVLERKLENHEISSGDLVMIASVGAGMNINAVVYQF